MLSFRRLMGLSGKVQAAPPTLDGILSLKGVIEVTEEDESEEDHRAAETAIISGFEEALAALLHMRRAEGQNPGRLAIEALDEIAALSARAESAPGRSRRQSRRVLPNKSQRCSTPPSVLTRIGSTRKPSCLLPKRYPRGARPSCLARCAGKEAPGRRRRDRPNLDFLAQELHRESNTLTAKATISSSRILALNTKAQSSNSASRCRTLE